MGMCTGLPRGSPRTGVHQLCVREIGLVRLEQGDFLLDQLNAVVGSLLAKVFPPPAEAELDSPLYPFHSPDFDPENPLTHAVSTVQRCAVRTLLRAESQGVEGPVLSGVESRRAREAQWDSFSWMRRCFDRALDDPELSYARCSKEIWELLKRLYSCGKGRVIIDFYANNPSWRKGAEAQRQLQEFIREVVQHDLLAAKPIALELMVFAANFLSPSFRVEEDPLDAMEEERPEGSPIYSEPLSYYLTSRLADLGVPSAEELLLERALSYAEESGEWSKFSTLCKKLAKAGSGAAQSYFADTIAEGLDQNDLHSPEALDELERRLNWLVEKCSSTSCALLASALESGEVRCLRISLSAEERLDLLKRRSIAGDELASNSLLRIYASNRISEWPLNLSPMERIEAIERLAEGSGSRFVRRALTIIYNINRIGESALFFSLEERYKRIELLAQRGCGAAAHIMLSAYLSDQLSLPTEILYQSPSVMEVEGERETLPLNLTHQERLAKLYALVLSKHIPAIDAIFDYLYEYGGEFNLEQGCPLLFELLMRRCDAKEAGQLLLLNENQVKIIDLLSSFYIALAGGRGDLFSS